MNDGSDFRRIIETYCPGCFIEVVGFDWAKAGFDRTEAGDAVPPCEVYVGLISNHVTSFNLRWRTRIKRAWRVLRGQSTEEIELGTLHDLEELIAALQAARTALYGNKAKVQIGA